MSKVVGIIGGMGPEATVDLMSKIIRNTPAKVDQDHIRMIVDNNPKVPCRVKAILENGENPGPAMADMGKGLEKAGADFLVIACNTAHYYINDVKNNVSIPVLNMIEETVEVIKNEGIKKIALIASTALLETGLYQKKIMEADIELILPDDEYQAMVMKVIFAVKSAEFTLARDLIKKIIGNLVSKGSETIILGCTELPLVIDEKDYNVMFYDPAVILSQAVVKYALNS
jgi:aspartate racemase